jgi:aminoglycoside phosphotransferase (APT) family kinase protein
VLAHVPGLERGASPLSVEELSGGSTNRALLVRTDAGSFVVRVHGAHGARDAEDRRRELALHAVAANAGLAPEIVWADAAGTVLITRHAAGRAWSAADMADAGQLARLGERLRVLHALPVPAIPRFDATATAARYRRAAQPGDSNDAAQLDAWVHEIATLELLLAREHRPPAIIHGDLICSNVIDGERLWLVDWEYAGVADPLFDLGCLFACEPAARAHRMHLLESAGLAGQASEGSLERAVRLYELLSALWTRV